MFTVLALLLAVLIGGIIFGVLIAAFKVLAFTARVATAPLKILFFPLVIVGVILKFVLLFAFGTALVAIAAAILIPLAVLALVIGVPVAIVSVLT